MSITHKINSMADYEHMDVFGMSCDRCGRKHSHSRCVAGEISDEARKSGWKTVPGKKLSDPMRWSCPHCLTDSEKAK